MSSGPIPATGKTAGKQTKAASGNGRYGNHIDADEGASGAARSAAGREHVISAAMPMMSNPAAQPTSMGLAKL